MSQSDLRKILFPFFLLFAAPVARSTDDAPSPPVLKDANKRIINSDYLKLMCRIYINEDGTAKTVEVLGASPPMDLNNPHNREFIKSVIRSVSTWTFSPNLKNGKSVAGYAVVPVFVDLAEPLNIDGAR